MNRFFYVNIFQRNVYKGQYECHHVNPIEQCLDSGWKPVDLTVSQSSELIGYFVAIFNEHIHDITLADKKAACRMNAYYFP